MDVTTSFPWWSKSRSVVAAVSYAAKLARAAGGFRTGSTRPIMIAQVQLLDVADCRGARQRSWPKKTTLLELANTSPTIAGWAAVRSI